MAAAGQIEWADRVNLALFEEEIERDRFRPVGRSGRSRRANVGAHIGPEGPGHCTQGRGRTGPRAFFAQYVGAGARFIGSEIELSQAESDCSKSVRRRILIQVGGLAARGLLQWLRGNASMPEAQGAQYEVPEDVTELIARPRQQLTANDMADLWLGNAHQARKQGILSL